MNPYRFLERRKARKELDALEFELRISDHPATFMEFFVAPAVMSYEKRFTSDSFLRAYSHRIFGEKEVKDNDRK